MHLECCCFVVCCDWPWISSLGSGLTNLLWFAATGICASTSRQSVLLVRLAIQKLQQFIWQTVDFRHPCRFTGGLLPQLRSISFEPVREFLLLICHTKKPASTQQRPARQLNWGNQNQQLTGMYQACDKAIELAVLGHDPVALVAYCPTKLSTTSSGRERSQATSTDRECASIAQYLGTRKYLLPYSIIASNQRLLS